MPTRIYDIHPHIISPDTQRYPITPLGGKQSEWSKERPASFEHLVAQMDEAGIAKAAIVHSSTAYGFNNNYLADTLATQGSRFTGVFSVDVLAADAPQRMREMVSKKLTGLRIYSGGSNIEIKSRLDDPRSFPAWECAEELGISACISAFPGKLAEIVTMVKRYPTVKLVIDGLFKAPIDQGPPYTGCQYLFDMAQYPNVYFKISTNNVRASRRGSATPETFFPKLVSALGASHLAWCSNFPASKSTMAEMVSDARAAFASLSADDLEWIFHRTAATLYPALADS